MDNTLLSTISVMNFNNIRSVRSLARKAYSPSTDFIFNNFKASRSYTDFIDYNAEQQVNDFLDRFNDSSNTLTETSIELKRLYLNAHENKDTRVDSDTLTAIAQNDAQLQEYKVAVEQLATTQIDNSKAYDKDGEELSAFGDVSLTIEQGGESFDININTETGQTNQDVLKDTATAINNSGADVKATVLTDNDNNSRLSVESKNTGDASSFNISGGFNEFINLNTLSSAKNASYTLNGENHESTSNTVSLDNGHLEVTFNNETSGEENLTVTLDEEPIIAQLSSLTKSLQEASDFLEDYSSESRIVGKYQRRLNYLLNANESSLSQVGIERDDAGNINFNEDIFTEKFQAEGDLLLKELDTAGGFIDQLSKFSSDLDNQSIQTLIPDNPNSILPRFNSDDFINYLSFSNSFNINAFYPTGSILDFNL
jgi:hypothetical protein